LQHFTVGTGSSDPGFICHFNNTQVKNVAVDAQLAARNVSPHQGRPISDRHAS
jgi:hypothetical protein